MSQPSPPTPSPNACSASCTLSSPAPPRENTPDASDGGSVPMTYSSPLYTSLLGSMDSPFAADAKMLANIPKEKNPRPLRSIFNDSAEYWVGPDDDVLRLVFPAKLHLEGRFNKSGEYFSLPEKDLNLGDIKSAKIQFEVLPLDDKEKDCPASAITCSQFALSLLSALHTDVEKARNASLDAVAIPPNVPFWRTYKKEDRYSLVVTTGAVFKDVLVNTTISREEATQHVGLISPSKARARANQALGKNDGKKPDVDHSWRICDLEDSKGRYSALLNKYNHLRGTAVQTPDVRDEHGARIHVSDYKTKLKEGAIVELEVILRL
ncbi:uncharacterized protein EDB91DRAFT_560764 [Suillus paluster]|uniref:uncharacterized protein n=1 Tax=Suillus paluster TaxID=48578 RepID=UPI001B872663|nr:uncharacterized protein EDB91DRAFT_560764 [Suillus paluster]KAG1735269.1 hypothetical protein EDB91DRAFT_560764 [Suillus paluster]